MERIATVFAGRVDEYLPNHSFTGYEKVDTPDNPTEYLQTPRSSICAREKGFTYLKNKNDP